MKNKRLDMRLSEDELNYIKSSASYHNMNTTEFIVNQCLKKEFLVIDYSPLNELDKSLSAIGNNINQIARVLNVVNVNNEKMSEEHYNEIKNYMFEMKDFYALNSELVDRLWNYSNSIQKHNKVRNITLYEND